MPGDRMINPNQLAMFMTADELHNTGSIDVMQTPESRFGGAWKSMDAMWATKRRENRMDGLDKDVAANGVQKPVSVMWGPDVNGGVVTDGHHRIQAAYQANPQQLVPVTHRAQADIAPYYEGY